MNDNATKDESPEVGEDIYVAPDNTVDPEEQDEEE